MMNITRPVLLLDEAKCRVNIRRIADKAKRNGIILRPHFKTHQSHEIGRWFREEGVNCCTVSSMRMASYFAADGWDDITVAFPLNVLEIEEINRLAKICKLNLLAVNPESVHKLGQQLTSTVQLMIEIDPGYNRTGLKPSDHKGIEEILTAISASNKLAFKGFLSHAGQSYKSSSHEEIIKVHNESIALVKALGSMYKTKFPDLILSVGDTPTCAIAEDFSGIDEMRPGNLVFFDLQQTTITSCTKEEVAIAMAVPVVAVNRQRNEIFVHGGGVHFAKDSLKMPDGAVSFGEVMKLTNDGWMINSTSMYMKSLSQEHGVIQASADDISNIRIGDVLAIMPVHACLAADVMGEYVTLDGRVVRMMKGVSGEW